MRFIRILLRWLLWLTALGLLCLSAIGVFWLVLEESAWDFIPDTTASILILQDGLQYKEDAGLLHARTGEILSTLDAIRVQEENLSRFLENLAPEMLTLIFPSGSVLCIADAGWRALFVGSGILAARSVFNPDETITFSQSEHTVGKLDVTIYHIGLRGRRNRLSLALVRNILLFSDESASILAGLKRWTEREPRNPLWATLRKTVPARPLTLLTSGADLPARLPCFPAIEGMAWSLRTNRFSMEIAGGLLFSTATNEGRGAYRLLRSNQYAPTTASLIPIDTDRLTSLLFDDLEELLSVLSPCFRAGTQPGSRLINDWAANELSVFIRRGLRYVHIRVVDPARALKARHTPGQPPLVITNHAGWSIRRMEMPAFLEPLTRLFIPGQNPVCLAQKGEHMLFGPSPAALLSLITAGSRTNLFQSQPKDAREILGKKCNFLLVDTHGVIPLIPSGIQGILRDPHLRQGTVYANLKSADGMILVSLLVDNGRSRQANMANTSKTTAPMK